ncbi:MAG: Imidazole glycerol phosphate synthase subunit hisF [Candidatus Roizmanbacteria bacterium GW2011_GWA2_37_7]|uniref:Histidine biosynthesis bifunctional protein HisIE n=1 Tax=Candidatus Roizmanbacteria bacterium GW2011_GWA2_37_7 TaxID=1618481 RepID=A0A0G0JPF9_9BACT|nr:MAG: Imidazole glycerol phosphate synthase subunit hisF [Candidatus Roizmanbacteria bacterium GW2011_GWA2_37_7]
MKLTPAIIQDIKTQEVYMLGYMNDEALSLTQKTGYVYFWSRKRKKLWKKGETSGNTLLVKQISTDCDDDTLLVHVELNGNTVCHTGKKSCFYKNITRKL